MMKSDLKHFYIMGIDPLSGSLKMIKTMPATRLRTEARIFELEVSDGRVYINGHLIEHKSEIPEDCQEMFIKKIEVLHENTKNN